MVTIRASVLSADNMRNGTQWISGWAENNRQPFRCLPQWKFFHCTEETHRTAAHMGTAYVNSPKLGSDTQSDNSVFWFQFHSSLYREHNGEAIAHFVVHRHLWNMLCMWIISWIYHFPGSLFSASDMWASERASVCAKNVKRVITLRNERAVGKLLALKVLP